MTKDAKLEKIEEGKAKAFWLARLSAGEKSTERVLVFSTTGPLQDLIRIEVAALGSLLPPSPPSPYRLTHNHPDAWFVEDEKLLGPHPKDPYKRIETIPSSREIRIEVHGAEIARSTQNVFLYETMLRPRFYLSAADVKWEYLRDSETTSYCPYKGMAK